ncbi:flagellar hook-length control protein FliK [Rhizobium cremeum]|uniref:flagellar hook-length control protein FliK n=1 Tax=Rhizobium cremeum TaxID=2813827 RepID=UPI001FD56113|nr:flagellar hook-length control protein FliK [Rhizobium cremeum]MCJ7997990.1 flagellar hook-length control protein FliK [Rhizobium cremeum]MCJ8003085.1 flagellar hook-length control protein FliK [Rhizobium cremeum]
MMNVVNTAAKATADMATLTGAGGKTAQAADGDKFSETLNAFDGEKPAAYTAEEDAGSVTQMPPDGENLDVAADADVEIASPRMPSLPPESDLASLSEQMLAGQGAQQNGTDAAGTKTADTGARKTGASSQQLLEIAAALAMSTADGAATDSKALAAALKKLAEGSKSASDLPVEGEGELADAAATDGTTDTAALDDMLSLLSLTATGAPAEQGAAVSETATAQQGALEGVEAQIAGAKGLPENAGEAGIAGEDAEPAEGGAVFRLQKSDTATASVDMHIAPAADGSVDVDVSAAVSKEAPVVQVVDSRRYLGLAPNSNALAVASTIASDPQWAGAMDPASKLANTALYAGTGNVVHTLKIQMNPVELGHVTATMRLVGEELSIHLTVQSGSAYRELTNDSSSIMDALKAQGFSVDQISVSISSSSDRSGDSATGGRQTPDMGQQSQQQGNRQGGGEARQSDQFARTPAGSSTTGGSDAGMVEGTGATGVGTARPEHVYL